MIVPVLLVLLVLSGCATVKEPPPPPEVDNEARLEHALEVRKNLLRLLQEANNVDDAIKAREHLSVVQAEIEAIETGKKYAESEDGFKSTKERTIVYGPVGFVLLLSKWIFDKSYIIYPWYWRVY